MEIVALFLVFLSLMLAGVSVATSMLAASILNVLVFGLPQIVVAERMLNSINSFPLLAVPFFILAGVIMNRAGLTTEMVEVSKAYFGHFQGGTAHVNVTANMIMSGVSGSASADCAAIGSMLIPTMVREGYPAGFAVGLTAAASCIGPIIPPSIVMVIYGSMTNLSIGRLFLAGALPGIAIGLALMTLVAYMARRQGFPRHPKLPWGRRLRVTVRALPALLAPAVILGGIVTGYYTATEAGVVACVYGLAVGLFVYREIKLSDLMGVLSEAVEMTAIPVFILASASIFGFLLTIHGFGPMTVDAIKALDLSPTTLLLAIVVLLLIVGLFVEGLAALLIFVPVFMPLVPAFGFDHIHFALIVIVTILIGTVTPPVGLQLYIASAIGRVPLNQVTVWPFVGAMVSVVLLMVFFPPLVTFLPNLVFD
ncbi:MAG: TRAP transporter large permease [Pseudomonadota bacterium]